MSTMPNKPMKPKTPNKPKKSKKPMDQAARRRATILRIASFPVILLLLVVAVKLIAMVIVAQITIVNYNDENYEDSAQAGQWNLAVNLLEEHKPHFNEGTALLGSRLFDAARVELELALETAPLPDSCDVRVNLSFAIEGQGDVAMADDKLQDAIDFYTEAGEVLAASDKSCPDTTERQEELAEKAAAAQEELDGPEEPGAPQDPGGEEPGGEGGETDSPFDDIDEKNQTGEQERQDQDSADRGDENEDNTPAKPW